MCGIYVCYRGLCTTYMCNMDCMTYTHKNYLNKFKTLEYYEIPKSMCGIYVWLIGLCTTYMCNKDSMTYITHEIMRYLNLYVVFMCEIENYVPHTCTTWILCYILQMSQTSISK